jgi:hypothetical protein
MSITLKYAFDHVKSALNLPQNLDFRVSDKKYGSNINRKTVVEPINLDSYLRKVDDSTRVGAFLQELERRIGAQVGAKIEIWLAGHRIDGRRSIAGLR